MARMGKDKVETLGYVPGNDYSLRYSFNSMYVIFK